MCFLYNIKNTFVTKWKEEGQGTGLFPVLLSENGLLWNACMSLQNGLNKMPGLNQNCNYDSMSYSLCFRTEALISDKLYHIIITDHRAATWQTGNLS